MLMLLVFGAAALFLSYCYAKLRYKRFNQYAYFPQLPTTLVLGHLKTMDEFLRGGNPKGHPGRLCHASSLIYFYSFRYIQI